MSTKKCVIYETLNSLHDLQIVESANKNEVRLSGIFGVCGIKNQNNRIYSKDNYGKMVESLQKVIATEGCPGELEHPNTMNITLENVSHKIESIEMNEDGTITGTILLLNTPKGKIAQALVEGGLPLYISSRGAGSIDENGHVTLSTIKTYDLVGTPGFAQAKLTLKKNQALECLNESLEDGEKSGAIWAIVEEDEDDLLGGSDDKQDSNDENQDDDSKDNDKESEKSDSGDEEKSDDDKDEKEDNKDIDKEPTMKDLKNSIDELNDKITNLEAELHIAKESLESNSVNYDAIEKWIKEEFAPEHKLDILELVNESIEEATRNIANGVQKWACEEFAPEVQNWVVEEFAPEVQNWVCEEFAPEVQNWICEEFAPEVQNWVCEEFAPEVQNWICEDYSPEVQNWVCEEFAPTVEGWICEEFAPEHKENIVSEVNQNVSDFMESQRNTKISEIDALLESIDNKDTDEALETLKESYKVFDEKYKGVYVVENMPAEYRPIWEGLDDQKKAELVRSSKLYDFTKQGAIEKFWENADMTPTQPITESKQSNMSDYHKGIFAQMMRLRKA